MSILNDLRDYFFHNKRKKKVIDLPMQAQLAVEILLHVLIFFFLLILVLYAEPFVTFFSKQSAEAHQNAMEWLVSINFSKWPLFVMVGIVVVIVSITMSHRIAGPFYKIRMVLDKYAARDWQGEMYLRKHDYFHSIVPVINDVRATVTEDVTALRRDLEALQTAAQSLPGGAKEEIQALVAKALERINRYSVKEG